MFTQPSVSTLTKPNLEVRFGFIKCLGFTWAVKRAKGQGGLVRPAEAPLPWHVTIYTREGTVNRGDFEQRGDFEHFLAKELYKWKILKHCLLFASYKV